MDWIRSIGFLLRWTCELAPWEKVHFPEIEEWYEDSDEEEWRKYRDRELEQYSITGLNLKVPSVYPWIKFVGDRIYEMEGQDLSGEYEWQVEAFGVKWLEEKGYSKERWAFWRERVEWITTVTALEKETRRLTRECTEMMGKIEERHQ